MEDDERERYRYLLYRALNLMQGVLLVENKKEHPVVQGMRYQALASAMKELNADIEAALGVELPIEDVMVIRE